MGASPIRFFWREDLAGAVSSPCRAGTIVHHADGVMETLGEVSAVK
ncbi:hypothetical protein R3Q06_31620 [Rhodococcus erythropolis]|nr:hypothetical protein [Rhodococcus erythropolis]MDV6278033.1 hypothetical protein [Rhodococcus erythropolis]